MSYFLQLAVGMALSSFGAALLFIAYALRARGRPNPLPGFLAHLARRVASFAMNDDLWVYVGLILVARGLFLLHPALGFIGTGAMMIAFAVLSARGEVNAK